MHIHLQGKQYDLSKPLSIAIPMHTGEQVNCYFAPPFAVNPVVMGNFIGDVRTGSPVNYMNVSLNPHGNGTHTECLRHIADVPFTLTDIYVKRHFIAQVITAEPERIANGDMVVSAERVLSDLLPGMEAVIIRTTPNPTSKQTQQYSGTNPPYLHMEITLGLARAGVEHLLVDLPSLDREEDGGKLAAHRAFWQYPEAPRVNATITELIYVPDTIHDGQYLLELAVAPLSMDAAPSWPVLYAEIS